MRTPGLSIPTRTHTHVRVAFRKIERKGEHVRVEGVQQESVSPPPKRKMNLKVQISAKYFTYCHRRPSFPNLLPRCHILVNDVAPTLLFNRRSELRVPCSFAGV